MALEADIGISIEDLEKFADTSIPETETYNIDWKNGRLSGKISGKEALHQYIYKTLKTACNAYLIYDARYGSKIEALVKQKMTSKAYIETDIPRLVKQALTDKRILNIRDFEFEWPVDERDAVNIRFTVDTIYGTMGEEVDI